MANVKFTDLPSTPELNATDIAAISVTDGSGSRKVSIQNALKKIFTTLDANSNLIINLQDPVDPQDAATRKFVEDSVSGSSFFYFFSDTADGTIPNYFLMYTTPTGEAESTKSAPIPANDTLITTFITETTQPTFTLLLAGIYDSHVHAAKTAGTQEVQIYWKLFKRDTGGTETEIFTSEISNNLPTVNTEFDLHGTLIEDQNLAANDRLVVKFYGNPVGVGTTPTATLYLEGTNASRVEIKTSTSVPRTFLDLQDTPSSYTNAKGVYVTNDSLNGVKESNVEIDDVVGNQITITHGSASLISTQTVQLNQDYRTTASPTWFNVNATNELDGQYGIIGGGTRDGSAQFQINSTSTGFLPPRMTTAQRTAISSPATGLVVYDTDDKCLYLYNGTGWVSLCDGASLPDEEQIYYFGANGNDANSGKKRQESMKLPTAVWTKINSTETPSVSDKFVIYNPDAEVTDKWRTSAWVSVYSPNTTYEYGGSNLMGVNCYCVFHKMRSEIGVDGIFKDNTPGSFYIYGDEVEIISGTPGVWYQQDAGTGIMNIRNFNVRSTDVILYVRLSSVLYLTSQKLKGIIRVIDNAVVYINSGDMSEVTFDIQNNGKVIKLPLLPNEKAYYVGKHGTDTAAHLGKNWDSDAYLTFGKAITEVTAETPSPTNRFTINCNDAGIYTEQVALNIIETDINAPKATLRHAGSTGTVLNITGGQNSINLYEVEAVASSDPAMICNGDSTSSIYLDIKEINNPGTGEGLKVLDGYVNGHLGFLNKLTVGPNGEINLIIDRMVGNIQLDDGSDGSLIIGHYLSGTINKGDNSTVTVTILNPSNIHIYHEYYMTGNTTATDIVSLSTPVKVAGTTTEGLNNGYFTHSNNKLVYDGTITNTFEIRAQLSWEMVESTSQQTLKCYIYLNGSEITKATMTGRGDNDGDAPFIISVQCLTELEEDDYIEIWVSQEDGSVRDILVNDMNVIVKKVN